MTRKGYVGPLEILMKEKEKKFLRKD
ncbi:hypothetical protein RDI58_013454 [Solanum bulbocastanum]|uniref:Uncharacterized protein n=1 Tax=Solanum bulbocastanum TaxID=147425 RepID=A0AAN8YE07_SOLBU